MSAQQVIEENGRPIVEEQEQSGPLALISKAVELKLGAAEIAQLWAVQKDVQATAAKNDYDRAMSMFKRNPPKIDKNRHVRYQTQKGVTEYDHATLDHVCEKIIPALSAVGIHHRYELEPKEGLIYVTCILTHENGHSERTTLFGLPDDTGSKNKIQAVGSAITYLQRYTLLAATGLATEDQDDDAMGGEGGTLDHVDERVQEILDAADKTSLMARFKANHEAAVEAQDAVAMLKFTNAKEQRKKELGA